MWTCNCCCRSLREKGFIFNLKCSWNIADALCWKTLSHSCPAVTTSVSLRDPSLSNITYSREGTQLEIQMCGTCLDTCGMKWIICQNTKWRRTSCTLLNRPVLPLCFRLCVLLVSSHQLLTPMSPGTVWFWICRTGIGQAQAERDELGWRGLDSGAVWSGPAKG